MAGLCEGGNEPPGSLKAKLLNIYRPLFQQSYPLPQSALPRGALGVADCRIWRVMPNLGIIGTSVQILTKFFPYFKKSPVNPDSTAPTELCCP
ncbi:hypothetical protein ANN_23559 [Periplaneta americana]|uniref:Uncharacterized protein n=1 Tax=Periplaneta americana TaxID=6978 RepID=A0ABQ8SMR7_PERAM|nr:hypothetical protein ANN_23559 [Periplaneta americana]